MAATLQQFLGQFVVNDDRKNFIINVGGGGDQSLTLATRDDYYIAGYTSEATNQLCEEFETQIQTVDGTATCRYDEDNGKITLTFSAATSVTWTDTELRTIMGFTSDKSTLSTYTSDQQCRFTWLPTRGLVQYPSNLAGQYFWRPVSNSIVARSRDGSSFAVANNIYYDALDLSYQLLTEAEVIEPSTGTVYSDFQTFWTDIVHAAKPVRFYPDKSVNTSTDYVDCLIGDPGEDTVGSLADWIGRHISNYNGLWDVNIPIIKYVP
jgi:hypothetical protein